MHVALMKRLLIPSPDIIISRTFPGCMRRQLVFYVHVSIAAVDSLSDNRRDVTILTPEFLLAVIGQSGYIFATREVLNTLAFSRSKVSKTPAFQLKSAIPTQYFQTTHIKMTPSTNAILLFLLFRLVSTFSLPSRDLLLENLSNSTNLYNPSNQPSSNRTTVKFGDDEEGTLTCLSGIRSPPLNPQSCQNAWEKIPLFSEDGEEVVFRHRHEKPPPAQP